MFKNIWDLHLDIKFRYSAEIPLFRRKDSAVLNMYLYDLKERKDISNFTKANLNIKFPSGVIKDFTGKSVGTGINTYIQYEFEDEAMLEVGVYDIILTIEKDGGRVSTQKFNVAFFDQITKAEYAFVKMMQDLQNQLDYMDSVLGNIILNSTIGQANGVVPLDAQAKVPMGYMPLFLEDHINTNVYLKLVHGFMVNKDLELVYETKDGSLEYVGHPDNSGLNNTLNLITTVIDSLVTLTYYGKGTATLQKWSQGNKTLEEMKVGGNTFTGKTFTVTSTGMHTIYYVDNQNREYVYKFNVTPEQLKPTEITTNINNGEVTITADTDISLSKYAKERRTVEWFRTNGVLFTGKFTVTEVGEYSIYVKDKHGREYVRYITVTENDLKPVIDKRPFQLLVFDNNNASLTVGAISMGCYAQDADGNYADPEQLEMVIDPFGNSLPIPPSPGSTIGTIRITKNGVYQWKLISKAGIETIVTKTITNIGIKKKALDLNVGDICYFFRTEFIVLEKHEDKILMVDNMPYWGSNSAFATNINPSLNSNKYPNSLLRAALNSYNFTDEERVGDSRVVGDWNYQYAVELEDHELGIRYAEIEEPAIYHSSETGVLNIEQLRTVMNLPRFKPQRTEWSISPVKGSDDTLFLYDTKYQTLTKSNMYTKQTYRQCYYLEPTASVWVKG